MQKIRYLIIALLCAVAQEAWAQTEVSTEAALTTALGGESPISIKLTTDIALSEKLEIASGKTVTIDLNGHKLDRGTPETDWNSMVIHNYGYLTITDGSGNDSGQITGGRSYNGGGILCEENATLTVNGGTFTDNQAAYYSETYPHGRGGAIFMNPNTTLTITGGKFENNEAYKGGAICNEGTVTVIGGTISGNTAKNNGGGIGNFDSGVLTITGGSITGNSVTNGYGGGVYIGSGTYNMSGNPTITNNSLSSSANNVYLNGTNLITCTGAFTDGAYIGISLGMYNRSFTLGYKTQSGSTAPGTYFHADNNGATLSLDGNEVSLDTQYTPVSNESGLRSAISNGANIKLTADINIGGAITVNNGQTVTINLDKKPTEKGVYIHNNKKKVIK